MIDYNFIKQLEGYSLKGYVPDPENSNSGVTVASGFDIGQRSAEEILSAFSRGLAYKLLPYVGLTKQYAVDQLALIPLTLTEEEAKCVYEYSTNFAAEQLEQRWLSETGRSFEYLHHEAQTVIASVAFQYGNLAMRTPVFWGQVTTVDWEGALSNLRNFGDRYTTRRNKEADLLEKCLRGV